MAVQEWQGEGLALTCSVKLECRKPDEIPFYNMLSLYFQGRIERPFLMSSRGSPGVVLRTTNTPLNKSIGVI